MGTSLLAGQVDVDDGGLAGPDAGDGLLQRRCQFRGGRHGEAGRAGGRGDRRRVGLGGQVDAVAALGR